MNDDLDPLRRSENLFRYVGSERGRGGRVKQR